MLDKEKSIILLKKNAKMNLLTAVLLLAYYMTTDSNAKSGAAIELSFMIIFVVAIVTEFVFVHYLNEKNFFDIVIRITRFVTLMVLAREMLAPEQMIHTVILASVLYGMFCLQLWLLYDVTETYSRIVIAAFVSCPLMFFILGGLLSGKGGEGGVFVVFIIIVLSIFNILFRIGDFYSIMFKRVCELDGIAVVREEERDEINKQSKKLVHINEQLSVERFKLKEANEIISRNNEEIRVQNEIVKAAAKALDIDKLMNYLVEESFDNLKADFLSFLIYTKDDEEDFVNFTRISNVSKITGFNLDQIEKLSYIESHFTHGKRVEFEKGANQELPELRGTNIQSFIISPVEIGEHAKGLYLLGSNKEKAFHKKESFIESLFEHITLAIDNTLLYSRMHNMATKDGLTGIYNRRYFNSIYMSVLGECAEEGKPVTVILFDIDKFKTINDTYGHIFGDEVIRFCGKVASKYGKAHDGLPVRYGGEEFVVVFQNKTTQQVLGIVEEMHAEIRNHVFNHDGLKIQVNTSVGVACYPENCTDTENLLNASDTAMYCSKKNGRGRITIYSSDM